MLTKWSWRDLQQQDIYKEGDKEYNQFIQCFTDGIKNTN